MLFPWEELYQSVRGGKSAALTFEAEGTAFIRNFRPPERLILLGGGHIAQPLCRYGADLGFSVTVVDDRPSFACGDRFPEAERVVCDGFPEAIRSLSVGENDYVAVITRGHRHDTDCLRTLLGGPLPRYLGMIGSRRRGAAVLTQLEQEGFARETLERIHTPIGLSINALTVTEIAVSIAAELIQCRRQDVDRRRKGAVLASEDAEVPLLEHLARAAAPGALLIVYETGGSTPVKSGAMMTVDKDFRTAGTIGGGCGENAALTQAWRLIGTGERRCITVDMSNDAAAEEGMVCGGWMKVLIEDISR